jgi:hypothetical protein
MLLTGMSHAQVTLIGSSTQNGSFELPATGKVDPFNGVNVPDWGIVSGGTYTDSGVQSTGSSPTPVDGSYVAFLMNNNSGIYNLVPSASYTMTAGDQYTLTMWACVSSTSSTAGADQLTLNLFSTSNGSYTSSDDVASLVQNMPTSLGKYDWQEYTLTYTAQSSDSGNQIGVYVANTYADASHSHYMDVDNFDLTVQTVPEPASDLLVAMGGVLVLGFGLHRRASIKA